jgi:hypothetical protein
MSSRLAILARIGKEVAHRLALVVLQGEQCGGGGDPLPTQQPVLHVLAFGRIAFVISALRLSAEHGACRNSGKFRA